MTLVWTPGYDDGSTYTPGKLVLKKDSAATDPNFDPNFANVSLLLHGDGTNGSTTITDNSPSPKTVTAVGSAQISTAQSKFGGASIYSPGSAGSYVNVGIDAVAGSFGTQDFTIELWIYPVAVSGVFLDYRSIGGAIITRPTLFISGSSISYYTNGSTRISGGTIVVNQWQHVALCRASLNTRLFVDGAQAGSTYADSTDYTSASSRPRLFTVGDSDGIVGLNGYIDDLRITKGVARYTAAFTPPTTPFPDR